MTCGTASIPGWCLADDARRSRLAPGSLDFDGDDFSIDHCRMVSARELGLTLAGRVLGLGNSTICTVAWKREPSRRMLFGIVAADGGNWIRPFARGACRVLSDAWLASARSVDAEKPDYLQCLLIDRHENQPFGSGVSTLAYEVRKDGSLARFHSTPRVIEEVSIGPDPSPPARAGHESPQRRAEAVPLKPDARLPTFRHVEADEPQPRRSLRAEAIRRAMPWPRP